MAPLVSKIKDDTIWKNCYYESKWMSVSLADICIKIFDNPISMQEANNLYIEFVDQYSRDKKSADEWRNKNQTLFNKIHDECKPCLALKDVLLIKSISFVTDTSESYDAIIYLEKDKRIEVECVTAMNQHDWALRREHMVQFGHAPVYSDIIKSPGSKKKEKKKNRIYSTSTSST